MTSVEINGSFYALQRPSSYAKWSEQTPDDFVFAVKGGRYITHMKRLAGVETALANFFASGVLALGPKLGPVLWQLPEDLPFDPERLASFFRLLPRTTRQAAELASHHDDKLPADRALTVAELDVPIQHALEFRSRSFCNDEAYELLSRHDVACVLADTAGRFPMVDEDTSSFRYLRLHGDTELYASGYDGEALDRWAEWIRRRASEQPVHVYFDNDARGRAPHDAVALLRRVSAEAGARPAAPGRSS